MHNFAKIFNTDPKKATGSIKPKVSEPSIDSLPRPRGSTPIEVKYFPKASIEMGSYISEPPSIVIPDQVDFEDFVAYLPHAFKHHREDFKLDLVVHKFIEGEDKPEYSTKRVKILEPHIELNSKNKSIQAQTNETIQYRLDMLDPNIIVLQAIFAAHNLIQIKLINNRRVPKIIFELIDRVIHLHNNLYSIVINRGIDKYTVGRISRLLQISNITDVCFDDATCPEARFHKIIENASSLQYLSLARCKIGDEETIKICQNLKHPKPASKMLRVLNLSTNGITDLGAHAIGECLRTNRTLLYLNLADNRIGDNGAKAILNSLQPFLLSYDEMKETFQRKMAYTSRLNRLIEQCIVVLKNPSETVASGRRRRFKSIGKNAKQSEKFLSTIVEADAKKVYEAAKQCAIQKCGNFDEPLDKLTRKDGRLHCNGNDIFTYLNLAYNQLSYAILEPLRNVLQQQSQLIHSAIYKGGLINVVIEGNPLPINSPLYSEIDHYLRKRRPNIASRLSAMSVKKRS